MSFASTPLQILSLITPERTTMTVHGEIDMATAPQLRHVMTNQLRHGLVTSLHLDLAGVTFMDSSGAYALLAVQRTARLLGGDLVLTRSSPQVGRLLALLALESAFPVEPTAATAAGA